MSVAEVPESESEHGGNNTSEHGSSAMVIEERPWIAAVSNKR